MHGVWNRWYEALSQFEQASDDTNVLEHQTRHREPTQYWLKLVCSSQSCWKTRSSQRHRHLERRIWTRFTDPITHWPHTYHHDGSRASSDFRPRIIMLAIHLCARNASLSFSKRQEWLEWLTTSHEVSPNHNSGQRKSIYIAEIIQGISLY